MLKGRAQRRDAYQRIVSLPERRRVETWLLHGVRPKDVARWLRSNGWCLEIQESSLIRSLQRMRAAITPDKQERGDLVNELAELEQLYRETEHRLDEQIAEEKQEGRLRDATRETIEAQMSLLVNIHQIKRRLGIARAVPPLGQPHVVL
jgi:predicted  nucleic acid-binding Zn-ribbon protein